MKGFHVSFRLFVWFFFFRIDVDIFSANYPPFLMANEIEASILAPFFFSIISSCPQTSSKPKVSKSATVKKTWCSFWCFSQFQTNFTVFRGFSIFKLPHERSKNHPKTHHCQLPPPRPKLLKRAVKELKIRSWSFCLKQMVETPPGSIQLSRFK